MDAYKNASLRVAYIIRETHLRQLDQIIPQTSNPRTYEMQTTDDIVLRCDDVETLIRQISTSKLALKKIRVTTKGEPYISLSLKDHPIVNTIEYELSGNPMDVPFLDSKLDDWIGEIKPWYSWLATMDFINVALSALMLLFGIFAITYVIGLIWRVANNIQPASTTPLTINGVTDGIYVALFMIMVWYGMAWGIDKIRMRLFPLAIVAIGYGLKQHNRLERNRRIAAIVVTALAIPLLVSLVANWISRGWK